MRERLDWQNTWPMVYIPGMPVKSEDLFWAVWPTAWGPMGGVAGDKGLRRLILPHYQKHDLEQLLAWEHSDATRNESAFDDVIEATRAYFNGKMVDFSDITCDLPSPGSLSGMVYRQARQIPYGRTVSYLGLAKLIDRPDAARAVATALGKNRIPLVIPCHRVTYSDGRAGGFSCAGGPELKRRMQELERKVVTGV